MLTRSFTAEIDAAKEGIGGVGVRVASIERSVKTEMERISQRLTQRIKELAERYETTLPKQTTEVAELEDKVIAHLQKMGFVWT